MDATAIPAPAPDALRMEVRGLDWGAAAQRILDGIDLDAAPGGFVGVIGPNGSGKSSLLRCIFRLHRPWRGRVALDGRDLREMTPRQTARRVAVVLQEQPAEFGLSVREVVQMGRIPHKSLFAADTVEDRHLVDEALRRVGLAEVAGRRFETLSGGEKQRALVARAVVQQPRLLILDEPTNHLDIRYQLELLDLVRGLGVTVLAALHDLNLAALYCTRLYLMDRGRMIRDGAPAQVLTRELIRSVFGVDVIVDPHPLTRRPRVTYAA